MNSLPACPGPEILGEGVQIRLMDDLCFVHCAGRSVDAAQTRRLGEQLIAFIERAGCRKLVLSFDGTEQIYGFLLDTPLPIRPTPRGESIPADSRASPPAGSDFWIG